MKVFYSNLAYARQGERSGGWQEDRGLRWWMIPQTITWRWHCSYCPTANRSQGEAPVYALRTMGAKPYGKTYGSSYTSARGSASLDAFLVWPVEESNTA